MTLSIRDEEVAAIYYRHTARRYAFDDPHWQELVEAQRKKHGKRRLKQATLGRLSSKYTRSQEKVREVYESSWSGYGAVQQVTDASLGLCSWREEGAEAHSCATWAVHNLLLRRALGALAPERVLEVGSGNGMNLFLLSAMMPEVRFQGAELTTVGVEEARKLQALAELPQELVDFAADPVLDRHAHARVEVRQASAVDLPFEDDAFDVVYTSLALEQMEAIRDQALASVARVARGHVVMVEPFRDFNETGMRHDYVRSQDIFSARLEDLPRFGLRVVHVHDDIPCKVALGVGLVVAEKVR